MQVKLKQSINYVQIIDDVLAEWSIEQASFPTDLVRSGRKRSEHQIIASSGRIAINNILYAKSVVVWRHGELEIGRLDAVVARILDVLIINFDFQRGRIDSINIPISTCTSIARSSAKERRTFDIWALGIDDWEEEVLGAADRAVARDGRAAEISS